MRRSHSRSFVSFEGQGTSDDILPQVLLFRRTVLGEQIRLRLYYIKQPIFKMKTYLPLNSFDNAT